MAEIIQPKPTLYKKIFFKSRLEARWAVFLDNYPEFTHWGYEDNTLSLTEDGILTVNYTPDFSLYRQKNLICILEVKPAEPSRDYMRDLIKISTKLPPAVMFLVAYGSFYKELPVIRQLKRGSVLKPKPLTHYFRHYQMPVHLARHYRFDLKGR